MNFGFARSNRTMNQTVDQEKSHAAGEPARMAFNLFETIGADSPAGVE
jgi:hypothetical protein